MKMKKDGIKLNSSKIDSYLQILDLIKVNGSDRKVTAKDIFYESNVGYTRTVIWLKFLRNAIDQKRPYIQGFRYSTQHNPENHRENFCYWFDDSEGIQ